MPTGLQREPALPSRLLGLPNKSPDAAAHPLPLRRGQGRPQPGLEGRPHAGWSAVQNKHPGPANPGPNISTEMMGGSSRLPIAAVSCFPSPVVLQEQTEKLFSWGFMLRPRQHLGSGLGQHGPSRPSLCLRPGWQEQLHLCDSLALNYCTLRLAAGTAWGVRNVACGCPGSRVGPSSGAVQPLLPALDREVGGCAGQL